MRNFGGRNAGISCVILHSENFEDLQSQVNFYLEDMLIEIVDVKFSTSIDDNIMHFSAMVIFKI
jgi:Sporulation protein Cse60